MDNDDKSGPPDLRLHKVGKQQEQLIDMQRNVERLKASLDTIMESQKVMAKIRYTKFQALIEAGFSEQQALELIQNASEIF